MFLVEKWNDSPELLINLLTPRPLSTNLCSCRLGRNLSLKAASPPSRCAICQVDQEPFEGLMEENGGSHCSSPYAPWGGPYLCLECRKKKDAMEGKRPSCSTACRWKGGMTCVESMLLLRVKTKEMEISCWWFNYYCLLNLTRLSARYKLYLAANQFVAYEQS